MVKTNKAIVGKFDFISRKITRNLHLSRGHAVAQLVEALRYKSRVRFPMAFSEFFIDTILPAVL